MERPPGANEPDEEACTPAEEHAGGGEERRERDRPGDGFYAPRAFLSSAVIAGTISWRSPTTA